VKIKHNIIYHGKKILLPIIFLLVILATLQVAFSYDEYSRSSTDSIHENYYRSQDRVIENGRIYYTTKDPVMRYQNNYKGESQVNIYLKSSDKNTRYGYGTVVDKSAGRTIYSYNSYGYATATSGTDHIRASDYTKNTYGTYSANYYRSTPANSDYYYSTNVAYYSNGQSNKVRTKYVNRAYGTTRVYSSGQYVTNSYGTGIARSGATGPYVKDAYGTGISRTSYSGNYVKKEHVGYGDSNNWDKPHYYARTPYQNTKYKTYSIAVGMDSKSNTNNHYYYTKTYKYNYNTYDYDGYPY